MNWKFLLFSVIITATVIILIKIVQLIEACINYLRKPANEAARETQTAAAAAANGVEFAITLEEIRIVSDDDAPPKPAENSPRNYGGLVYDACSCTTIQESSTGEVGDDGCCAICIEEYAVGERRATVAACNHRYHASCIEAWMAKDEKHSCPLCRQIVD